MVLDNSFHLYLTFYTQESAVIAISSFVKMIPLFLVLYYLDVYKETDVTCEKYENTHTIACKCLYS